MYPKKAPEELSRKRKTISKECQIYKDQMFDARLEIIKKGKTASPTEVLGLKRTFLIAKLRYTHALQKEQGINVETDDRFERKIEAIQRSPLILEDESLLELEKEGRSL